MKSLMSASPFSLHLSKATPFGVFSLASKSSSNLIPTILQSSISLHTKPRMILPKFPIFSIHNRRLQSESSGSSSDGEIHVIVGPMFAGKTTTLLRRIQCESENGRLSQAVGLLWGTGLGVDSGTYALLLQECIYRKEYKKGRRIHAQMVVVRFIPNEYLKTKLLILYAKLGDLETAKILFHILSVKSLISWNAMIAGYIQKGLDGMGLHVYYKMRENGMKPDQYTFASVFRACATLATLEHGKRVHGVMIKSHIEENVVVNSALIDMYFKCCSISDGHLVFDKSLSRNVITWTALISGYGQHGRVMEVLESFSRMKNEGLRPNDVTFLAVLCACSHGGLVDEGWDYFLSMTRDYGIRPRGQHYAAMVDLLGRAGRLQEAYDFILKSPCMDHSGIWGALLGACRIHGDIDMIKLAAKKFFELEPENSGKYVVLSNAYATHGFWNNVAEVRLMMRNTGLQKEPGYSRIWVQNNVHYFLKGDESHHQSVEIYELINEMSCVLNDVGCFLVIHHFYGLLCRSVAVIKSNKDTRYRLDSIVTHDGMKLPCSALANLSSFRQKFGPDAYDKLDVIGIDEAQFFDDLYDFCREAADHDGKIIIVAGLDGDYLRKSFGSVLHIIPLANSVTKLNARCEICGKRAFFTLRKTEEIQTELIGGADVYMPVCRQHYVGGQVALDAARILSETQKVECGAYA
ncbi:hypothetical protein HS088_TW21G01004 [Tripterygium wilfordii]|uniref:thymidine kinase n=1 Tax=Tripterygium wilfordii TaxID=458696 RepID=A0A7J7C3Y1_TRIWF|nr:hypothetical protein HS088_TW21G01004 [Tripterygium wilfordii]